MVKNVRSVALGALIAALALSHVPALSGTHGAGSLRLLGADDSSPIVSGVASFTWEWTPGSVVSSNSIVDLRVVESATGDLAMRKYRYVRWGSYAWDTSRASDGIYTVTAFLRHDPSISSTVGPIYIDNTAPQVAAITQPAYTGVVLNGSSVTPEARPVSGSTTLAAETSDNLTGVAAVEWWLDHGAETAALLDATANEDGTYTYDFSGIAPGEHTLTAVAIDGAGNRSDADTTVTIFVIGTGQGSLPDPGQVLPSDDPSPQPTPEPSLPEVPDPNDPGTLPEVPDPEPSDPSTPPAPEPDPSNPPQPPVPLPLP